MPAPQNRTSKRPAPAAPPRDGRAASDARVVAPKEAEGGAPHGVPRPRKARSGGRAERRASEAPAEPALRGLLRGLRAGDLETVLLTVAMAAEENRMPSADPDEVQRILAFLARLAEHDAALLPLADGGQKLTRDGIDAEGGGAPAR